MSLLQPEGVDYGYEDNYFPHPPTTIPVGSFAYLAEKVKKIVGIPVVSSTRIGYPDVAEKILSDGKADFVSLGRPLIADPYWCQKAKAGHDEDIRPCLACHEGCLRRLMAYKKLSCAVNPVAGDEEYLKIQLAEQKKTVRVIGGGISGIVSAIVCYRRGHDVTLYESSDELGGNFKSRYIPDFKEDYRRYISYLKRELGKTNVKVVMNHQVTKEEVREWSSGVIVNASGASFRYIPIKGVDKERLINPFDLYDNQDFTGKKVAIIGGGLVGVEAALNVARHGGEPFLIEKMDRVAQTAYPVNRQHLELLLEQAKIPVYLNSDIEKVDGNIIIFTNDNMKRRKEFNLICECVGMQPCSLVIDDNENVIHVGDAVHPENVMNAVWTAYRQCRLI